MYAKIRSVAIYALPEAAAAVLSNDPGDGDKGRRLFNATCAGCHGESGTGCGGGPELNGIANRRSYGSLVAFIEHPPPPMPRLYPGSLSRQELRDMARFLAGLH